MPDDKRKHSHLSDSSDGSDYDKKKLKKIKKAAKKKLKKEFKLLKKIKKEKKRHKREKKYSKEDVPSSEEVTTIGPSLGEIVASKARAPMTKEEWEKQQSVVRRVFDEGTNRYRLIKGSGEVIEECVSKERHKAINKQATQGDGHFFQNTMRSKINQS